MAEERIIDDEYGRGVKLRKTAEGYVDVTDELAEGAPEEEAQEEEISFAFPIMEEEDDEDLVGLSPEEAAELRQRKLEAAQRRRAEYEELLSVGNAQLEAGDFVAAEATFERALLLDEPATDASVGYWRAKTENFAKPDVLIEEYVEPGIESLEYDLGYEAADIVKREYRAAFEKRYEELAAERAPLEEEVVGKQERRREILKARRKKNLIAFVCSAVPMVVFIALAVYFILKITSTPDGRHIPYAIAFGVVAFVSFLVFGGMSNKLLNTARIYKKNERLTSTEEGEELFAIIERMDLYGALLGYGQEFVEEEIEETEETEENE